MHTENNLSQVQQNQTPRLNKCGFLVSTEGEQTLKFHNPDKVWKQSLECEFTTEVKSPMAAPTINLREPNKPFVTEFVQ